MPQNNPPIGCPIDALLRIVAREWTAHVVFALGAGGPARFADLRRALPGAISARVLTVRLRELEALAVVSRHDAGGFPRRVTYALTPAGQLLHALLRDAERLAAALPAPLRPVSSSRR